MKTRHNIIFSADYDFQVLNYHYGTRDEAWNTANGMYETEELKDTGVEHYDVVSFPSLKEMNEWIMEQVKESRKNK